MVLPHFIKATRLPRYVFSFDPLLAVLLLEGINLPSSSFQDDSDFWTTGQDLESEEEEEEDENSESESNPVSISLFSFDVGYVFSLFTFCRMTQRLTRTMKM